MSNTSRLISNERDFILFSTQVFFNWFKRQRVEPLEIFPWQISRIRHWFFKVWSDTGEVFVKHVAAYCLWKNVILFLVPDDSTEFLQMTGFNTRNYCYSWLVLTFLLLTSWPMGTQGNLCMYCLSMCIRDWFIYTYILWIKCNHRM